MFKNLDSGDTLMAIIIICVTIIACISFLAKGCSSTYTIPQDQIKAAIQTYLSE